MSEKAAVCSICTGSRQAIKTSLFPPLILAGAISFSSFSSVSNSTRIRPHLVAPIQKHVGNRKSYDFYQFQQSTLFSVSKSIYTNIRSCVMVPDKTVSSNTQQVLAASPDRCWLPFTSSFSTRSHRLLRSPVKQGPTLGSPSAYDLQGSQKTLTGKRKPA